MSEAGPGRRRRRENNDGSDDNDFPIPNFYEGWGRVDLAALGLREGDTIRIASRYGEIPAIVEAEDAIRRGVISMSHCFGGTDPESPPDVREAGANTGLLSSVEHEYDPHSGIPRMSAIPVRIGRSA